MEKWIDTFYRDGVKNLVCQLLDIGESRFEEEQIDKYLIVFEKPSREHLLRVYNKIFGYNANKFCDSFLQVKWEKITHRSWIEDDEQVELFYNTPRKLLEEVDQIVRNCSGDV